MCTRKYLWAVTYGVKRGRKWKGIWKREEKRLCRQTPKHSITVRTRKLKSIHLTSIFTLALNLFGDAWGIFASYVFIVLPVCFCLPYYCCSLTNANIELSNEIRTAHADLTFSRASIKKYANLVDSVWWIKSHEIAFHVITAAIQGVLRTYLEKEDPVSSTLYHTGDKYSDSKLEWPVLKPKIRHVKFNIVWSHCRRQPSWFLRPSGSATEVNSIISVYGIFSPVAEMKSCDSQSGWHPIIKS